MKEPLHPAQLYEAFLALGVFGVLYSLRTRKRFPGQLALTYLCLAGLVRFMVEFFRHPGDYRGPVLWGWMPMTQAIALSIAVISGILLGWWGWRFRPRDRLARRGRQRRESAVGLPRVCRRLCHWNDRRGIRDPWETGIPPTV